MPKVMVFSLGTQVELNVREGKKVINVLNELYSYAWEFWRVTFTKATG